VRASSPSEQAVQLSGETDDGAPLLCVLVKRTYRLDVRANGAATCMLAEEQLPLHTLQVDEADPEIVVQDADIYPWKPLTDVIVRGHARSPRKLPEFTAGLGVGSVTKTLAVVGDRRCARSSTGGILFGEPEPVDDVPLRYDRAYGGVDRVAEARHGNPYAQMPPYMSSQFQSVRFSPYRYPRNGVGRGYLIEPSAEALESLALPNLEDPADRLSPDRLAVGSPRRWPTMPLPWCTDWLSFAAFPRVGFLGGTPSYEPTDHEFAEARRGFIPSGYPRRGTPQEMWHGRACNAGSLGLQLGPFTARDVGAVLFRLMGLHPRQPHVSFRLPEGGPQISVDGRDGKLLPTLPAIHHVVIEPDCDRVSVVWRGSAPALRRYALEELLEMPFLVVW
jgi:hypothetical protein